MTEDIQDIQKDVELEENKPRRELTEEHAEKISRALRRYHNNKNVKKPRRPRELSTVSWEEL